jgi:hypothetical protein
MADNHFRQIAEQLQAMASVPRPPGSMTDAEREVLQHAAKVLCRLEQMKRDLISSDYNDDAESERLAAELMDLLGIHPSEHPERI